MIDELVERFENPDARFGPLPLWWWSGERLEIDRLRWQLDQLTAQNVRQAVVMNLAPTGPLYGALADDPEFMSEAWWDLFTAVVEYADAIGFRIWLYDQIGFSGANVQGRIVAAEPRHAGRSLAQVRVDARAGTAVAEAPQGAEPVAAWIARRDQPSTFVPVRDGRATCAAANGELVLCFATPRGFDYFSAAASDALIDAVYGEYQRRVGGHFGSAIAGAFQDELPDVPTWSADFRERFRSAFGYDLVDALPALWGDPVPADAPVDPHRARLDYHRARARFARESFFLPLARWLDRAGLPCGFDQQSPAREGMPIGSVEHYADYLATHSTYAIPGSDHWGDSKLHSSLAHAHGHERVWIEAFHSSGWGGTLEETYDWLAPFLRRGANLYDPHAVYYSTRSGWFEWAPPSTCWRQPYWPVYGAFATAVARLCAVLTAGDHVASTVLIFPTETVQAHLTVDGRDLGAAPAERAYVALNGAASWFAEKRGILERSGIDYDILTPFALADAQAVDGALVLRGERYRNVVLPAVDTLPDVFAGLLVALAEQGGTVVCVGTAPSRFIDGEHGARRFRDAVRAGLVAVVERPEQVPGLLQTSSVSVDADAPVLHRVVGDTHVFAAFAHDERSGTVQPMLPGFDDPWASGDFDWPEYWRRLGTDGYRFVPPAGREVRLCVRGLDEGPWRVQLWDPRTGARTELEPIGDDGGLAVTAEFSGSCSLIVVGRALPAATTPALATRAEEQLTGPWSIRPLSTLDNRWGDLDAPDRTGIVPIQVWEFQHRDEAGRTHPAIATFGVFAEFAGPDGQWHPLEWSLSRGIRKDPIHDASLGPNGYVPEEFLLIRDVRGGDRVRVRTWITVPERRSPIWLAIGANADRGVRLAGTPLPVSEPGYLTFSPVHGGAHGLLELDFVPDADGDLRAFFALTTDPDRFARPEWIRPDGPPRRGSTVEFSTVIVRTPGVHDTRVQLSTEAPSVLRVNGVEVGRQSDFDPYAVRRFTRVHPYDLAAVLRQGENTVTVTCTEIGRPAAIRLDAVPRADGGLGVRTDTSWRVTRDGRPVRARQRLQQYEDPRYGTLVPRPHPLQPAAWLEQAASHPSVATVVPDVRPARGREELLSFAVPAGAVRITVPTAVPFDIAFDDGDGDAGAQGARPGDAAPHRGTTGTTGTTGMRGTTGTADRGDRRPHRDGSDIVLARPAEPGTRLTLRFHPVDGRRGGALLDGPLSVECAPVRAELSSWADLGLASLGGAVQYERVLDLAGHDRADGTDRVIVDLGEVRGTVQLTVDGAEIGALFAGPWRFDITDALAAPGPHTLRVTVRGTLAPYLDVASPTSAVVAGQTRHGLFGPVRILFATPLADGREPNLRQRVPEGLT